MAYRSFTGSVASADHMITLDTSLKAFAPPQDDLHASIGNYVADQPSYPQTPFANYADVSQQLNGAHAATPSTSRVPFQGAQGSSHIGVLESRSSSISPLKSLRNVPPDKFQGATGPIQMHEADDIFDKVDMNADGIITHAELARSMFHTPEVAERLNNSGDPVLQQLVQKGRERLVVFAENETFNRHELKDLLCHPHARGAKSSHFVAVYELDRQPEPLRAERTPSAFDRVSEALGGLLVTEPKDASLSAFSATQQGLIQSNHELTRRLQLNLVKSEKDDARIKDLETKLEQERSARLELESQMRVEMRLSLEVMKGKHLAVVQNMQAQHSEETDRLTSRHDTIVRELQEQQAEKEDLLQSQAQSREAQLTGQLNEAESQRTELQQQLAELQAKHDALVEAGINGDEKLLEANRKIQTVEDEKARLMDELAEMTAKAEQLQADKEGLEAQGLHLDQNLSAYQQREKELNERIRSLEASKDVLGSEKRDLMELVKEHEMAHDQKDKTVRQSIALGKQAIEERHDLARRQVAAWTELEVQRSICRANNGILGMDALDAIRKELGHTVGDPDVPVSVASVTGEKNIQDQDFDKLDPALPEHEIAPHRITARERRQKLQAEGKTASGVSYEDDAMGLRRFGQFKVSKKGMTNSSHQGP